MSCKVKGKRRHEVKLNTLL